MGQSCYSIMFNHHSAAPLLISAVAAVPCALAVVCVYAITPPHCYCDKCQNHTRDDDIYVGGCCCRWIIGSYQQSLIMRQQVLGPYHPEVAVSLNNLAELYRHQHKYAEAEPLYLIDVCFKKTFPSDALRAVRCQTNMCLTCKPPAACTTAHDNRRLLCMTTGDCAHDNR
eukprot:3111424-Pyramimonas_sp.AAC.1